ncbi:RHS repeat-associated core domain-containing protein [Aquimarina aggregata]|uniref:RHS repeat-associated core domain-containing protein n=1 Tax=Aquimarina aggregata TaxID=1642818 RepID=UPI00248F8FB5|nr:RHS repeat-associated core domain-containing protein [Aquimarina aggregata]
MVQGTGTISYIYDATGAKLKKTAPSGGSLITTEYASGYVYKNGNLEFFNQSEGIVEKEADGYKYIYQYADHLGNIRLSYSDKNGNGTITTDEIVQEKNYYPFGLTHKGLNNRLRGRNHNYGYNSKEENQEIGLEWLDYGARNYNTSLGRWMNIDPLADRYTNVTPYAYVANTPNIAIDPDGRLIIFIGGLRFWQGGTDQHEVIKSFFGLF